MSNHPHRPPVSTRHAFALAFALVRRDPLHSLAVPLLLRGAWLVLLGAFAVPEGAPLLQVLLGGVATIGFSCTGWAVDSMLRFRARSVFNQPSTTRPLPVMACYRHAIGKLPWLYVTEFVRNAALASGFSVLIVPGLWLGYKLAFSTEAVVLDEPHLSAAFRRSWRLSQAHFERWLEMVVVSVGFPLVVFFAFVIVVWAVRPRIDTTTWTLVSLLAPLACFSVIQYAWTFFYLRVCESEGLLGEPYLADHPVGPVPVPPLAR
jgi:glycerophosphoryl diester phosphodiesterase family protein